MLKEHTRIELVEGGNIFRQGEHVTLSFTPRDYAGNVVDLSKKSIAVAIWSRYGVMYEGTATYDSVNEVIRVRIEETLQHGDFYIEFTATDSADPSYRQKFPSGEYEGRISIKPSSDNMDVVGVKMTTVTQLRQEQEALQQTFEAAVIPRVETVEGKAVELEQRVNDGIGAFTEDTELIDARMGEVNLREFNRKTTEKLAEEAQEIEALKLDKASKSEVQDLIVSKAEKTYVDTRLSEKVGGAVKARMEDLDDEVISAVTGGATVNVLSIPQDESVTASKTNFLIPSPNLFDKSKATLNKYVAHNTGLLVDASTNDTSDFIEIEPSATYIKNSLGQLAFYDSGKNYLSGITEGVAIENVPFQTPSNAKFIRFSIKKSLGYTIESTQLEKGSVSTTYTPFGTSYINPNKLDIKKNFEIKTEELEFILPSRNIFNKSTASVDKYVDPNSGAVTDTMTSDTSDFIPVKPSTNYIKNVKGHVAFYNNTRGYAGGVHENTALANTSFKTSSDAAFLRFSIKKSEGFNINETQLEEGVKRTNFVPFDAYSVDPTKVEVQASKGISKFDGNKMNFLGDSITAAGAYQTMIHSALGLGLTRNYGVGGTTLVGNGTNGFLDRYAAMDNDADIVFVQGGTNDFSIDIPMSKYETDLRSLIEGLCQKYKGKIIVFATLPPRYIKYLGANNAGHTTLDYANKTKQICAEYSIPIVDLHNESGINRFNMDLYMPDMVHPNSAGYKKLTNLILSKMKEINFDY